MFAVDPKVCRSSTYAVFFRGVKGVDVQLCMQCVLSYGGVGLCHGDTIGGMCQRIYDTFHDVPNSREAITRR